MNLSQVLNLIQSIPGIASFVNKSIATKTIDPYEAFYTLSSIDQGTKKVADRIKDVASRGGGLPEVAREVYSMGDVNILGTTINPRNIVQDLKGKGAIGNILANLLEWLPNQSKEVVEEFGNNACNFNNWMKN